MTDRYVAEVDAQRVSSRRVELGYSVRALAAAVDVAESVIRRLENPDTSNGVDEDQLDGLVVALDCPAGWLTGEPGGGDDAAVVGATLLRVAAEQLVSPAAVATGLGWTLSRLEAAFDLLDEQLRPAGLTVHRSVRGVGIRPVANAAGEGTAAAVMRVASRSGSTQVDHAAMLHRIARGEDLPNTLGNADQVTLRTLINAGYVEMRTGSRDGQRVRLTEEVRYSLGLGEGDSLTDVPRSLVARTPPGQLPWLDGASRSTRKDDDD